MLADEAFEYQWPYLLSLLPPAAMLDAGATECGAISRKRSVDSASTLLRLALVYSVCGYSLRQTAAWAESRGIASLSDVALFKRLCKCQSWLGQLLAVKLADRAPIPTSTLRLRLIDATSLSQPGSLTADWRIHLGFDPASMAIDHIEVTDRSGAESLTRFAVAPNEVALADRGYAHRAGLWHIHQSGGHFVVRTNWLNVPLTDEAGARLNLLTLARSLDEAQAGSFAVRVAADSTRQIPSFGLRLVVLRKSEAAATVSRQWARRAANRGCRMVDPRTLEAAGYVFLLTSLPEHVGANQVLELYRFRWQIELAFKRLKSILQLGVLPAKNPALARTILYGKLLGALLLEDFTSRFLAISPWGYPLRLT